jgi:hypothetical protein
LFMFKRLVESGVTNISIAIFEKKHELGAGMPYSTDGASKEHITNVSGNEIPELVTSIADWIKIAPHELLDGFALPHKSIMITRYCHAYCSVSTFLRSLIC